MAWDERKLPNPPPQYHKICSRSRKLGSKKREKSRRRRDNLPTYGMIRRTEKPIGKSDLVAKELQN